MRLLFTLDTKDYDPDSAAFVRPSVRAIIIKDGTVAMVHSLKYDYYKFPGGGMEPGESQLDALIRETREEAGLIVIPNSIQEYGYVHRVKKSDPDTIYGRFIQDNFYYLCSAEDAVRSQELDDYEAEEHFTLEYVLPESAIRINRTVDHGPKDQLMLEREALVLEHLQKEGIL